MLDQAVVWTDHSFTLLDREYQVHPWILPVVVCAVYTNHVFKLSAHAFLRWAVKSWTQWPPPSHPSQPSSMPLTMPPHFPLPPDFAASTSYLPQDNNSQMFEYNLHNFQANSYLPGLGGLGPNTPLPPPPFPFMAPGNPYASIPTPVSSNADGVPTDAMPGAPFQYQQGPHDAQLPPSSRVVTR